MEQSPETTAITARTAAEVCRARTLSDPALELLDDLQTPLAFLDALVQTGLLTDAEALLAHALPKREAVWWGCRCVRLMVGAEPSDPVTQAIRAAESWTAAPGEVNRRRAFSAAEVAGFGHPAGCLALAAFLSGGSLAPANLPEVPPAAHLTGDCVASALKLAAVLNDPAAASSHHRFFLDLGRKVALGEDRWKPNL